MQRFPTLSKDEIAKMVLGQLTPLEQTKAAQELIALGEARGEAKGEARGELKGYLAGQIVTLQGVLGLTVSSLDQLKLESIESLEKSKQHLQDQLKLRNS